MNFEKYMPDTVTVTKFSSKDERGNKTYSGATTHYARIEYRQHIVINAQGQDVPARGTVYLAASSSGAFPLATPDDQLTLPDASTPPILSVTRANTTSRAQHEAIHFD